MDIFEEIGKTDESRSFLVVTPTEKLQGTIFDILRYLLNEGSNGIYVTISKPYKILERVLSDSDINVDNLQFVDCISRTTIDLKRERNALYVTNRGDVSSLGIAITQCIRSEPNKSFLLIDAIETLLIYNKIEIIAVFIQSLIKKASENGLKMVILTSGKDTRLLNRISLFFDKIIEVK